MAGDCFQIWAYILTIFANLWIILQHEKVILNRVNTAPTTDAGILTVKSLLKQKPMRSGEGWIKENVSFVGHGSCGPRGPGGASESSWICPHKSEPMFNIHLAQRMGSHNTTSPPPSQIRATPFILLIFLLPLPMTQARSGEQLVRGEVGKRMERLEMKRRLPFE